MSEHDPHSSQASEGSEDDVRETDFGDDVAEGDMLRVSTDYDPNTAARLKKAVLIFAVVLVVLFIAVRIGRHLHSRGLERAAQEAMSAPPPVDVIRAKAVGTVQSFGLPGETAAWHASTIYARVDGYVGKWFVDIGDHVHHDQVLALLETPELDAQLQAARAQLQAAQAQVLVGQATVEFARTTYDRWRDSPKGVVSEQEREAKKADYDSARARLTAAEAQVALDRAQVDRYLAMSQFKRVTAPFDGVITSRDIDIGNLVTAGSTSSTTPLYVITQNDPMRIFVDVPQSAAAELMQQALPVSILTSDGQHRTFTGKVARTAQAINPQARTLKVEVDIPNGAGALVPGMYVKIAFNLPPKGLVQVPAAALLFRAGGPQVARIDHGGRIVFQNVTIARDDGNVVELGSGVQPGDRLALNLSSQVAAGELVKVNDLDAGAAPAPAPLTADER